MARLIFGMMQSLDGYVAGAPDGPDLPVPGPALHRHFNDHVRGLVHERAIMGDSLRRLQVEGDAAVHAGLPEVAVERRVIIIFIE